METLPTISIVTPNFNQDLFLQKSLESVFDQRYPALEYIVVDGASTDMSISVLEANSSRIDRWISEPDQGQYDAVNKGFAMSSGEVMGWINSDDLHFPWTLETVGSIMATFPQIEWLTTLHPAFIDESGFVVNVAAYPGVSSKAFLDGAFLMNHRYSYGFLQQEATFWRRSLWDRIGARIPTGYPLAGDFALWMAFSQHAIPYVTPSPLAGFRFREGQRSEALTSYVREAEQALELAREASGWRPNHLVNLYRALRIGRLPFANRLIGRYIAYSNPIVERIQGNPVRPFIEEGNGWRIRFETFL